MWHSLVFTYRSSRLVLVVVCHSCNVSLVRIDWWIPPLSRATIRLSSEFPFFLTSCLPSQLGVENTSTASLERGITPHHNKCPWYDTKQSEGCPRGVMVKAMGYWIVVSEFVLQSRYYVHFRANTVGKCMNPPYPPSYGLNSATTVLLGEWLWH